MYFKPTPLLRKMLKILFNSTYQMSRLSVELSRKPGVHYPSQEVIRLQGQSSDAPGMTTV